MDLTVELTIGLASSNSHVKIIYYRSLHVRVFDLLTLNFLPAGIYVTQSQNIDLKEESRVQTNYAHISVMLR